LKVQTITFFDYQPEISWSDVRIKPALTTNPPVSSCYGSGKLLEQARSRLAGEFLDPRKELTVDDPRCYEFPNGDWLSR
jgi:hypothetical protein